MRIVIDQLVKIDGEAYENEQRNSAALAQQKQRFEDAITRYRDNRLKEANDKSKLIYDEIASQAQIDCQRRETEIDLEVERLERQYLKVEEKVIARIFSEFFGG